MIRFSSSDPIVCATPGMPNCNPFVQSKKDKIEYEFQITTKKRYVSIAEAKNVLQRAGRTIAPGLGDSLKMQGATHG